MWRASLLLVVLSVTVGCFGYDKPPPRKRSTVAARADSAVPIPGELQRAFVAPAHWEQVNLPSGLQFSQPPGFTIGVSDGAVGLCDTTTLPGNRPVLALAFSQRWPLTVRMRRGERAAIARANGFVLDSTEIVAIEQPAVSTKVRHGEGWILVSVPGSLFGAVRHPNGCQLVWVAHGTSINVDTLGLVLGTVRFGAPSPPAPRDSAASQPPAKS